MAGHTKHFSYHPNDVIDFFTNLGYSCFRIDDAHLKPVKEISDEAIEANFVFIHSSKHEVFSHLMS